MSDCAARHLVGEKVKWEQATADAGRGWEGNSGTGVRLGMVGRKR